MTVIVSDTSPINYLVLIEFIDVLPALFGSVIIPPAVHEELMQAGTPAIVRAWISPLPDWINVRTPAVTSSLPFLDIGERQAIALAQEMNADFLLIDERRGSRAAREQGLKTAGTLLVLETAHYRGLLSFEDALRRLQSTNFFIHPAVIDPILLRIRNGQPQQR